MIEEQGQDKSRVYQPKPKAVDYYEKLATSILSMQPVGQNFSAGALTSKRPKHHVWL